MDKKFLATVLREAQMEIERGNYDIAYQAIHDALDVVHETKNQERVIDVSDYFHEDDIEKVKEDLENNFGTDSATDYQLTIGTLNKNEKTR
jgi:glycosyltransferase A (GT-A) superfamily protein (DUF2064 family)